MPEIIDKLPDRTWTGAAEKYPYDEWFDGRPRRFASGVDFNIRPTSFAQVLYGAAARRNIKIETRVLDDVVYAQSKTPVATVSPVREFAGAAA